MRCGSVLILLILLIVPNDLALAVVGKMQDEKSGEDGQNPQTEVCVVFLGASPPRRYSDKGRGGEYAMLLPAAYEVPPSRLYRKAGKNAGHDHGWLPFMTSFNNPLPMTSVTAGESFWLYRKKASGDGHEKYVLIPAGEEGSRRMIFLTPSVAGSKPWLRPPQVRIIGLDSPGILGNRFILKNLSGTTVLHAFEQSVSVVPPEKMISYQHAKSGMIYRMAARYGKQKKIIYNTAVRLDAQGITHLYVLYDVNPKTNAGRKVGVFSMRVSAPKAPVEPDS